MTDKEIIKNGFQNILAKNQYIKDLPADERFYILVAKFEYCMETEKYNEASNIIIELVSCYNMLDSKINYHLKRLVEEYGDEVFYRKE